MNLTLGQGLPMSYAEWRYIYVSSASHLQISKHGSITAITAIILCLQSQDGCVVVVPSWANRSIAEEETLYPRLLSYTQRNCRPNHKRYVEIGYMGLHGNEYCARRGSAASGVSESCWVVLPMVLKLQCCHVAIDMW